jgi:hypothetical protein
VEKLRHLRGDWTPEIPDKNLQSRLKKIRARNGGNIGVFFISAVEATGSWEDPETGFNIKPEDAYLVIDLPNSVNAVRSEIDDSMRGIAYYLWNQGDLKYVLGTTYEKIAQLSRHFGFALSRNPMPDDADDVRINYPDPPRGHSGKDFLRRYLNHTDNQKFAEN